MDNPVTAELVKKVIEERKEAEKAYHKERVLKLQQEKIELELRLFVLNDLLKQIDDYVKNNPLFQE
jgi:hypothetical protein